MLCVFFFSKLLILTQNRMKNRDKKLSTRKCEDWVSTTLAFVKREKEQVPFGKKKKVPDVYPTFVRRLENSIYLGCMEAHKIYAQEWESLTIFAGRSCGVRGSRKARRKRSFPLNFGEPPSGLSAVSVTPCSRLFPSCINIFVFINVERNVMWQSKSSTPFSRSERVRSPMFRGGTLRRAEGFASLNPCEYTWRQNQYKRKGEREARREKFAYTGKKQL